VRSPGFLGGPGCSSAFLELFRAGCPSLTLLYCYPVDAGVSLCGTGQGFPCLGGGCRVQAPSGGGCLMEMGSVRVGRSWWPVVVAGRGGSSEHEARLQVGLWRRLPGERTVQPSRHLREIPSGAGEAAGQTLTQR